MKLSSTRFQCLVGLLLLFNFFTVQASHNIGCTITYSCLGNDQYEFTMVCYRDCSGIFMQPSEVLNFVNNGTCSSSSFNATLNVVPALSGIEQSQLCDNSNSTCQGGNLPGREEWVYRGTVTLPAGCIWTASYQSCCRGSSVTNLQNASSAGIYVETIINTSNLPCNNSVQFSNIPMLYTCDNNLTHYNPGAYDPDGDLLVFSLTTPQNSPPANIPFVAGLSSTNPLFLEPSTSFVFDTTSGQMTFTPQNNLLQMAMIAVKIDEVRNGVVIASTIREIQIIILTNCNNATPIINTITTQGMDIQINGTNLKLCRGAAVAQFQLVVQDLDGDSLTINTNIASVLPGVANYTVNQNNLDSIVITFTINSLYITAGIYNFSVNINDNHCPLSSLQSQTYTLRVLGASYISTAFCINSSDPTPIIVGDSMGIFRELPTNPPGLVLDSITGIIDISASNLGIYTIVYEHDSAQCISDTIVITIVDTLNSSFNYPQSLWCRQGIDPMPTITGTMGGTFSGDAGLVINPFTGVVDISETTIGFHKIYYTIDAGACFTLDSFSIDVMEITNFEAIADDYIKCANTLDSIQLGSIITYTGTLPSASTTYTWTPNTNINNPNINNPKIIVTTSTVYTLEYNDGYCSIQRDSVEIFISDTVNLLPVSDIGLCRGDTGQIGAAVAAVGLVDQTFIPIGSSVIQVEDTSYATIDVLGMTSPVFNHMLINSLELCMTLNVERLGNLKIFLIAPSGEIVPIMNRHGGIASVLTNATFSTTPSNLSLTPYVFPFPVMPANSSFLPVGGVSGFNGFLGATINGIWTLMIVHSNGGLSTVDGSLVNWCLNFQDFSTTNFSWSPSGAGISCIVCDSPMVSPVVNTSYTVVAANLFGCTDTATITVSVDGFGFTAIKNDITCDTCADGNIVININGGGAGFSYLWSSAETTSTINGLVEGIYCVTITNSNGCSSDTCIQIVNPFVGNTIIAKNKQTKFIILNHPTTTPFIDLAINSPIATFASMGLYSIDGKEIMIFENQNIQQGDNLIQLPAALLPNGLYTIILSTQKEVLQQKLIIQR